MTATRSSARANGRLARNRGSAEIEKRQTLRCAIYTRVSTDSGLEQDFNSLDAQREACTAYIRSQAHEGWKLAPGHYDDGGYSGGNLDRPGLTKLLEAVKSKSAARPAAGTSTRMRFSFRLMNAGQFIARLCLQAIRAAYAACSLMNLDCPLDIRQEGA